MLCCKASRTNSNNGKSAEFSTVDGECSAIKLSARTPTTGKLIKGNGTFKNFFILNYFSVPCYMSLQLIMNNCHAILQSVLKDADISPPAIGLSSRPELSGNYDFI